MLSDEEIKAIERLNIYKEKIKDELYPTIDFEEEKALGVVLNLIEKQSKEIEELKNKYEEIYNEIDNKNSQLVKALNYKLFIEDKIKAKIEELEIEQESNREDLKIAIDNLLFQNIDKIGNKISINMSVRGILQSLLEKE